MGQSEGRGEKDVIALGKTLALPEDWNKEYRWRIQSGTLRLYAKMA